MDPLFSASSPQAALPALQPQGAVRPGGIGIRFLALMIDGIILSIIFIPLQFLIMKSLFLNPILFSPTHQASLEEIQTLITRIYLMMIPLTIFMMVIQGCYYGWFYSRRGATPGKSALGLKVVNCQTGQNLGFGMSFLRETLGRLASGILLIGYIMAMARPDKRALHDLMVGSQVIEK